MDIWLINSTGYLFDESKWVFSEKDLLIQFLLDFLCFFLIYTLDKCFQLHKNK